MKQTAVEWLHTKLSTCTSEELVGNVNNWFEQAKKMEKEQIIDAFGVGCHHESKRLVGYQDTAEQYYNETFNADEK
jgi:hypothetical protein